MPEWLTRRETPQSIAGRVAGFKSEWWPTSNRNGGRLRLGIPGRLQSESAPNVRHKLSRAAGWSIAHRSAATNGRGGRSNPTLISGNLTTSIRSAIPSPMTVEAKATSCSVDCEPRSWSARRNVAFLPTAVDSIGDRTVRTNLQYWLPKVPQNKEFCLR